MKPIIRYIKDYFYEVNKIILLAATMLTALLVFFNYYWGWNAAIDKQRTVTSTFTLRYLLHAIAFIFPYLLYIILKNKRKPLLPFIFLLLLAPVLFAFKATVSFSFLAGDSEYWQHTIYWPIHFVILSSILFFTWKLFDNDQPFYGIKFKGINWKPYWLMLLLMVPLIATASTQPDFLAMYPKIKTVTEGADTTLWQKILFELSYGSDFISIELFFRGFLILAFIKYAGKDAILPMACFYCTIHFGKPLGECISSYFGGIILGVVVYHTRSILGGLIVHLGIAWMMEIGGFIGNEFF